MNSTRTTDLKVGIFTLLGIVVLLGGVMWGKQMSLSSGTQSVIVRFPSSSGLIAGDAVTVNGVKLGRVESIAIDGNGVIVHASLDKSVQLRSDATASIMMLELMGGKKIDVRPGVAQTPLDPNSVINGVTEMDIPAAIATIGAISGDLTRVLFRADTLLGSVNHLMADSVFVQSIRHTVISLDATVALVHNFIARNQSDFEASLKDVKELVGSVKTFFESNRGQMEALLKSADKTLANVDVTLAHADSTIATANIMLNEINHGNGSAHKLIFDKEFATELDSTVVNAHRLFDFILEHGVNINVRLGTRP